MDFIYSKLVDPSEYETQGLCDRIPLRMHTSSINEVIGTIRCQKDWNRLVEPIAFYKGGLDARWSFMSTAVPECLPERLEIISYANEFAFLYDDETENHSQEQLDAVNDEMEATLREAASTGAIKSREPGKKQIQAQILHEMMSIDPQRALTTMKAWAEFIRLAAGRQHGKHFSTLEEYLPYRSIDVGKMFWYGVVTFGMALTIPDHELDICHKLVMPAYTASALQNDIFSWEKERDAARCNAQADVVNAVWVLMCEHSISEAEALTLCREETKKYVAEYIQVVEKNRDNEELSVDLRKYVSAILYSLSGNAVWSITCPRYHPENSYNEFQLSLMENYPEPALNSLSSMQTTRPDGVTADLKSVG